MQAWLSSKPPSPEGEGFDGRLNSPKDRAGAAGGFIRSPEIRQQMVRCLALDGLHHSARRQTRRHAQQQMHMFSAHVTAYNFDVVAATDLPNQLPHPQCHITPAAPACGTSWQIRNDSAANKLCAMTSDRCSPRNRTASLLKASPKGEGFHPPREWKVRFDASTSIQTAT